MSTASAAHTRESLRAVLHYTPASGWLCDAQRPVRIGESDHLFHLAAQEVAGPGGWHHTTTTDRVRFTDEGLALPKIGEVPVWSGCAVRDEHNTAGFGADALVVVATRLTAGDPRRQEQYVCHSRDEGQTFSPWSGPVLPNPGGDDWFRDPKIVWDQRRSEWIMALGRAQRIAFYTSPNLTDWTARSEFSFTTPNIGGMECPDIFEMTADDGSSHWMVGASVQGDYSGYPNTFAYWHGDWDGERFTPDVITPKWLDWGMDFYAAVTWPSADQPRSRRYAIAWMNNWQYAAREVPTNATDGFNGQLSIVRELGLERQVDGTYTLMSRPIPTLQSHVSASHALGDLHVDGPRALDFSGTAYRIRARLRWDAATNVGLTVGRSADGRRGTNIGVHDGYVYCDRSRSDRAEYSFGQFQESRTPIDRSARDVQLEVLVDRQSVEVFVQDGWATHSSQVYFVAGDTGIGLYSDNGAAVFGDVQIDEFKVEQPHSAKEDASVAEHP